MKQRIWLQKLNRQPCTIPVKVGEGDKYTVLFSAQEIAEFLKKEGFDVLRKRHVDLAER